MRDSDTHRMDNLLNTTFKNARLLHLTRYVTKEKSFTAQLLQIANDYVFGSSRDIEGRWIYVAQLK